jgi:hypothetical protein
MAKLIFLAGGIPISLFLLWLLYKYLIFWEIVEEKMAVVIFRRHDKSYLRWHGQGFYWLFSPYAYRAGQIKTGRQPQGEITTGIRSCDGIPFEIKWNTLFNIDLTQCANQEALGNLTRGFMRNSHTGLLIIGAAALREIASKYDARSLCDGRLHTRLTTQLQQELKQRLSPMGYNIVATTIQEVNPSKNYEAAVRQQHEHSLKTQTVRHIIEQIKTGIATMPTTEQAYVLKLLLELEYIDKLGVNGHVNHLHAEWPGIGPDRDEEPPHYANGRPNGRPPRQPMGASFQGNGAPRA